MTGKEDNVKAMIEDKRTLEVLIDRGQERLNIYQGGPTADDTVREYVQALVTAHKELCALIGNQM